MRPLNDHYSFEPRIVPADKPTRVAIRPRYAHGGFDPQTAYTIRHLVTEHRYAESGPPSQPETWKQKPRNGILEFDRIFPDEQEHVLLIEKEKKSRHEPDLDFRCYSLHPDLFDRRPWKGDLHLHSTQSDGTQSPPYVAAASRAIGLDFMAVTDHRAYAPSLEAIHAFQQLPIDLAIFPGEEVHPPGNPAHIVSFAARFGIQEQIGDEADHRRQIEDTRKNLPPLPRGVDPHAAASNIWAYNRIREGGGLAIFPHPYWMPNRRYAPPGPLTDFLLEHRPFDAFEVIGGAPHEERYTNYLQTMRYADEIARRGPMPVVGSSDTHDTDGQLFGWFYSIVFARSTSKDDLLDAIRNNFSVAVDNPSHDEIARVVGPFRLVKYAMFLIREIMPGHDALCAPEGRLMMQHLAGDTDAPQALARAQGNVAALYAKLWAKQE